MNSSDSDYGTNETAGGSHPSPFQRAIVDDGLKNYIPAAALNLNGNESRSTLDLIGTFKTYVPKRSTTIKSWKDTVQCPGCSMEFPAVVNKKERKYHPDYYEHCVTQCKQYKKQGQLIYFKYFSFI